MSPKSAFLLAAMATCTLTLVLLPASAMPVPRHSAPRSRSRKSRKTLGTASIPPEGSIHNVVPEKKWRVHLYEDLAPPGRSKNDFFIDETISNRRGKWWHTTSQLPAEMYAAVLTKKNASTICRRAISPTVVVQ